MIRAGEGNPPESLDHYGSKQDEQSREDEGQERHHLTPERKKQLEHFYQSKLLLQNEKRCPPVVMKNVINDFREVIVGCRDPPDHKHLKRCYTQNGEKQSSSLPLSNTSCKNDLPTEANSLLSSGSRTSWMRMDGSFWSRSSSSKRRSLSSSLPFHAVTGLKNALPAALRLSSITTCTHPNTPPPIKASVKDEQGRKEGRKRERKIERKKTSIT